MFCSNREHNGAEFFMRS